MTLVLLLLVAGCTSSNHNGIPRPTTSVALTGQLAGVLLISSPMRTTYPTSGSAELVGPVRRQLAIGSDGRFVAEVPPGQYRVTGHSPPYGNGAYDCIVSSGRSVQVSRGQTTQIEVVCLEK